MCCTRCGVALGCHSVPIPLRCEECRKRVDAPGASPSSTGDGVGDAGTAGAQTVDVGNLRAVLATMAEDAEDDSESVRNAARQVDRGVAALARELEAARRECAWLREELVRARQATADVETAMNDMERDAEAAVNKAYAERVRLSGRIRVLRAQRKNMLSTGRMKIGWHLAMTDAVARDGRDGGHWYRVLAAQRGQVHWVAAPKTGRF